MDNTLRVPQGLSNGYHEITVRASCGEEQPRLAGRGGGPRASAVAPFVYLFPLDAEGDEDEWQLSWVSRACGPLALARIRRHPRGPPPPARTRGVSPVCRRIGEAEAASRPRSGGPLMLLKQELPAVGRPS